MRGARRDASGMPPVSLRLCFRQRSRARDLSLREGRWNRGHRRAAKPWDHPDPLPRRPWLRHSPPTYRHSAAHPGSAMQVEIVTIGNEVLSGRTLDTNFAFLARALEEASVAVAWHSTVSDSAERIAEGLTRALDRADAVVMTGGLGPTPDDVTRRSVAAV